MYFMCVYLLYCRAHDGTGKHHMHHQVIIQRAHDGGKHHVPSSNYAWTHSRVQGMCKPYMYVHRGNPPHPILNVWGTGLRATSQAVNTYMNAHRHKQACTHAHTRTFTHIRTRTHTHTHAHTHTPCATACLSPAVPDGVQHGRESPRKGRGSGVAAEKILRELHDRRMGD